MFWNHRVLRRVEHGLEALYIVEVYYDTDSNGIIGWTGSEEVWGEDVEGLKTCLEWMTAALEHPILDEAELLAQSEALAAAGDDVHQVGLVARAPSTDGAETVSMDDLLAELGFNPDGTVDAEAFKAAKAEVDAAREQ